VASCVIGLVALVRCHTPKPDKPVNTTDHAAARAQLVHHLRAEGISDARVLAAIGQVPRHEFVRPDDRDRAYSDQALPIAGGQTISQPYVVALMTQLLELHGTERVLEIGTGSGYQAAVLALTARAVYSIEIDAQLAMHARERLRALGYTNVQVRHGDGFFGWPEAAPFDAVIITAAAPKIPERLVEQLRTHGNLVMPLAHADRQSLIRARKKKDGSMQITPAADVLFVPMTGAVRTPAP